MTEAIFLPKHDVTWVSLQTVTYYKSKSTKYFDILLLLVCEKALRAPTVQF